MKSKKFAIFIGLALLNNSPSFAQNAQKAPSEILASAPKSDWVKIDSENIIQIELQNGAKFYVALSEQTAKIHVANIKKLINSGYLQGNWSILRSQDNYVVQWGTIKETQLPDNVEVKPPEEYEFNLKSQDFTPIAFKDAYAPIIGTIGMFPAGSDGKSVWLTHCYGMVGVGRDLPPDTGTGSELYAVIGHAPRHLDRNITIIGRVIWGIENISALARGTADLGFYKEESERTAIKSANLLNGLNETDVQHFEYLNPKSQSYKDYVFARANREGGFFIKPANAVDVCNAIVPVRKSF